MRKFRWISAIAALALAACGGGSNGTTNCGTSFANSCGTTGTTNPTVASVLLVTDTPTIPSDNSQTANFTAYIRDKNNNFVANVPVVFTTSSGGLSVTQGTTDANGVAKATLNTLGDRTNRTITVTATANQIASTAMVVVSGTTLAFTQGLTALTAGQQSSYTVVLSDFGKHGIANTPLTVTAPSNLTVSATALTTDANGSATFTATAGSGGTGTLTVTGLGLTASTTVTVNGDALSFSAPGPATQIPLNTSQSFTAKWLTNGTPVVGQTINFSTTRGCINPAGATCVGQLATGSAVTDATGSATVAVLSDNAGGTTVTATTPTGTTASLGAQFIATVAASIVVQPSVFTLSVNPQGAPPPLQQSTISAVVRDANNNLVTGAVVLFSLSDITGGTLSTAVATTDIQGRAATVYTAGSTSSSANGVKITASVQGQPTVTSAVALTVAKLQAFISIGTGNAILTNAAKTQYEKDYIVQVTDINGAGVANVPLSMSVLSGHYFKGYRVYATTVWANCFTYPVDECTTPVPPAIKPVGPTTYPLTAWGCNNEDINRNGILDPGEDNNHNGKLDPGNIALVSPSAINTDANGFASVAVYYPEEYAYWLEVTLQAQAQVQGTAFSAQSTFILPGLAADFATATSAPPGPISPFGQDNSCTDTL